MLDKEGIPSDWITRYGEFLRKGDIENMIVLKEEYFPRAFFKYRELSAQTLTCLRENWLYMSEPGRLNDIFECSLTIDNNKVLADFLTNKAYGRTGPKFSDIECAAILESTEPYNVFKEIMKGRGIELPETSEIQAKRVNDMWNKDFADRIKYFRICSFSTTNASLLMWAHYSKDYRGVCIEYDFLDESESRAWIHPVYYSNSRPSIHSYGELLETFPQIYASVCKSKHWEYEQEWRYIAFLESQVSGKENHFKVPLARAIYLGPMFELNDEKLKSDLLALAQAKGIPVYRMSIDEFEYRLTAQC